MKPGEYDPELVKMFFHHDYQDRGMLKWQGYYLSDHTSALNKQTLAENERDARVAVDPMGQEAIFTAVGQAILKQKAVAIFLNEMSVENGLPAVIEGRIMGQGREDVIIVGETNVHMEQIRAVKVLNE
ncbi:hypothetical protein [Furfurilactobacillus entadae]|uniref:hypothetical protein n=1 Tax=Furfurilactobacillus entadae TaxID=2922307 RepID=UPI0035EB68E0